MPWIMSLCQVDSYGLFRNPVLVVRTRTRDAQGKKQILRRALLRMTREGSGTLASRVQVGAWSPDYFGWGGGRSRATHADSKPAPRWPASQKGLVAEAPHRHRLMILRPARPNGLPSGSWMTKSSPSTFSAPLFMTVILVGILLMLAGGGASAPPGIRPSRGTGRSCEPYNWKQL